MGHTQYLEALPPCSTNLAHLVNDRVNKTFGVSPQLKIASKTTTFIIQILVFLPYDGSFFVKTLNETSFHMQCMLRDHLCGLVVRVPGYISRGPGSIPGAARFFWEVVGLEQGPLSLVGTIEELLGRKSSGSYLENREYGRRDPSRWPRDTLYPQKLTVTSPTSGGRSVGIVRSRT
jgi:hypothetical protein